MLGRASRCTEDETNRSLLGCDDEVPVVRDGPRPDPQRDRPLRGRARFDVVHH